MKISTHLASAALSVVILTATAFLPASAQSGPTHAGADGLPRRCRKILRRACRQAAGDERLPARQQGKTFGCRAARWWKHAAAEAGKGRARAEPACPMCSRHGALDSGYSLRALQFLWRLSYAKALARAGLF